MHGERVDFLDSEGSDPYFILPNKNIDLVPILFA
jgi:hypothetical protein